MAHEDLNRTQHVESSSDRAFGLVFAAVFLAVAAWPVLHGESPRWWALGVSAVFASLALVRPAFLAVPNRLWTKLGIVLGAIVSPVALGILFFGVVTPLGALGRFQGKDPLRMKRDASRQSYWIPREPPGPPPTSMTNQF